MTPSAYCAIPFCDAPAFEHALFEPGRELCGEHYAFWILGPRQRDTDWWERRSDSNATVLGDERMPYDNDNT